MTQYLITALIDFFIASLCLSKKDNKAARALAWTAICLGVWSLELYLLTVISDVEKLSVWFHITRCGMFFIPSTLALLAWRLTASRSTLFLYFVVLPGFACSLLLSVLNLFFYPSELQPAAGGFLPKPDFVYYAFSALFVYSLLSSLLVCVVLYKSVTLRQKQRIRWLFITLLVTFLTGFLSIYLMIYDFYLAKFVGTTANVAFASLLFYSTVQHHLMDFRLALSESLTRASVLAFFVLIYFSARTAASDMSGSMQANLIDLLFLVLALEAYPRILKWLLPNAKKLFSKDSYEYKAVVSDTSKTLNECVDLLSLKKVCDHLFNQVVRVKNYNLIVFGSTTTASSISQEEVDKLSNYCAKNSDFVLADEASPQIRRIMEGSLASVCLGIRHGGESCGILLVGHSSDLSYYRYDDIRLFEWLAHELGSVVARIKRLDKMQEQLGQAKKTLSMLGVMNHYHHDIKAPLAIIDGVLSNDVYAKDKNKQREIVLEQVERGSKLIATMAGILKGERKRKVQALSLVEVVRDSLFLFSQGIDEVNYQFAPVPDIYGDAEDLKILVINLIKNAMEARREGEMLTVTVSTWRATDHISLSLRDTGCGMSAERVENIWEDAISNKQDGNGIGLQAVKRIADEHTAEIEVKSRLGEGSEFIFKFPMSSAAKDVEKTKMGDAGVFAERGTLNKPMAG